ncbi:hypothetical protein SAMN05421812_11583 [Asanoa hainanensis]|uniref:Uncharacterized protein n=1 Tax=Asanoa hainanensis TaxID=560556 RepID=A0A239P8H8_9ACTN|nr:DUF6183 family protein [Asanoa hainanensis]SNT63390.1 hypothetical protein SAMN05421812_11583 [Asanoa hainanensis]
MTEVRNIVDGLPRLERVTEVWEMSERRLADGDAEFLADLGIALTQRYGQDRKTVWQYRAVFDHLVRLLTTTPGPANVEQVLRLVDGVRAPYLASLLAAGQSPRDLAAALANGGPGEELRVCLVHELVLRGVPESEFAAWAVPSDHPLGWLPLSLTALEGRPSLPNYNVHGSSATLPYGPFDGPTTRPDIRPWPSATETTTGATASAMATAVAGWADESNGRIEARVFEASSAIDDVASTLPGLGLASLGEDDHFTFAPCTPGEAWRVLFAAASTGGAYNAGAHGAYGRLAAWRSVAALAGAPVDASVAEVDQVAHAAAWYQFGARNDWFEQVAWDVGLVAVTADRRRIAVLAATDTD